VGVPVYLQLIPVPGRCGLPDDHLAVVGARSQDVAELGMGPGHLPDGSLVALELRQRLVVLARVEDADAAVRGAGGQQQAVEVQGGVVDHVLVLGVDFLQQAHHLAINTLVRSPEKLNKCKSCFFSGA